MYLFFFICQDRTQWTSHLILRSVPTSALPMYLWRRRRGLLGVQQWLPRSRPVGAGFRLRSGALRHGVLAEKTKRQGRSSWLQECILSTTVFLGTFLLFGSRTPTSACATPSNSRGGLTHRYVGESMVAIRLQVEGGALLFQISRSNPLL